MAMSNTRTCPKCGAKAVVYRHPFYTDGGAYVTYECGRGERGFGHIEESSSCDIRRLTAALAASEARCERLEAVIRQAKEEM